MRFCRIWHRGTCGLKNGIMPQRDFGEYKWAEQPDSVISAGYKFGADHPAVSTVITGTSSIEHLEANARSLEKPGLPRDNHDRLVRLFGDSAEPD